MKQAIISDGKVINIIEISGDTAIGLHLPIGQYTYDCGQYPVAIGDDFADGIFTRNGESLTEIPTVEGKITAMQEDNLAIMQALAEVYEMMIGG